MNSGPKICLFTLSALGLSVLNSSCRKEKDTTVEILVVDTAGDPVSNAMVRLYPTPTLTSYGPIIIDDTLYTKADGTVIFDYTDNYNLGQAGFAVLDIEVRQGALYGVGIVKAEAEKRSNATVVAMP